jgi:hypothetical protein
MTLLHMLYSKTLSSSVNDWHVSLGHVRVGYQGRKLAELEPWRVAAQVL